MKSDADWTCQLTQFAMGKLVKYIAYRNHVVTIHFVDGATIEFKGVNGVRKSDRAQ